MSKDINLKIVLKNIKTHGEIDSSLLESLTNEEKELVQTLYDKNLIEESLGMLDDIHMDEEWSIVREQIKVEEKPIVRKLKWESVLRYAAIFIAFLSIIYVIKLNDNSFLDKQISENSIKLKIEGNLVKIIKKGQSRKFVSPSGEVIAVQKGNTLKYKNNINQRELLVYNELDIPYGEIFDLELSDGTLIHLNSGSKIKYPVQFLKDKKREVFIEGEGYFKVAKDKNHAFVVNTGEIMVEVFGTEFNLSTYEEDLEVNTVLVEGSVGMTNFNSPDNIIMLGPGFKGSWNKKKSNMKIEKVDVDTYTGWLKGDLIFKNSTFEKMTKSIERKYNVTIQNNNLMLTNKVLNAHFNVNVESIEDVMKSISEIYPFNYKIQENKIIIE